MIRKTANISIKNVITLTIGEHTFELTMEEAKSIRNLLNTVVPADFKISDPVINPISPIPWTVPKQYPDYPTNPFTYTSTGIRTEAGGG
jgi:hypothetical protein